MTSYSYFTPQSASAVLFYRLRFKYSSFLAFITMIICRSGRDLVGHPPHPPLQNSCSCSSHTPKYTRSPKYPFYTFPLHVPAFSLLYNCLYLLLSSTLLPSLHSASFFISVSFFLGYLHLQVGPFSLSLHCP